MLPSSSSSMLFFVRSRPRTPLPLIRIIICFSPAGRSIPLQISIAGEYYAPGLLFLFVIGLANSLDRIEVIPIFSIFVVLRVFTDSLYSPEGVINFVALTVCTTVICIIFILVAGILPLIFVPVSV